MKEKSIEGSNAKFTWGVKNGKELQRIVPEFSVRNISNKIIVLEKLG